MKLSNFKLTQVTGEGVLSWKFYATVDVETGILFFKKKVTREIAKTYTSYWSFTDTGEYTPDSQAESLCRAYESQHRKQLQEIVPDETT